MYLIHQVSFYLRLNELQQSYSCNRATDDKVPVNKNELFIGHCSDLSGLKYNLNESVRSCCECLM